MRPIEFAPGSSFSEAGQARRLPLLRGCAWRGSDHADWQAQLIGFGLIGAGTWGSLHARVYGTLPGARLAAVCDLDADRARKLAEPYGASVCTDLRELVADPEIRAVSVALPDPYHREAVI